MSEDSLKWQFDVSTFRLLGRELITDRITALFELVKNAYDANAEEVFVEFHSVGEKTADSKIIIRDNGTGMSKEDIKKKWMVIGTKSKRTKIITDPPYNRRVVGEKGLGRFAVDKLGTELTLKTKQKDIKFDSYLKINWTEYEKLSLSEQNEKDYYFNKIGNKYWEENNDSDFQGTELIIGNINELWDKRDIERAYNELSRLVSPFENLYPPFDIYIYSDEHTESFNNLKVKSQAIKHASLQRIMEYDMDRKIQQVLKFDGEELKVIEKPISSFGPIKFKLFYFDQQAKTKFRRTYKGKMGVTHIDGVKVYRDGIITTPFAEYESHPDKQRDILGIDKRRWTGFWEKVSSRDLIGIIEIKKEKNPGIIDSSNRQDFVENKEYRDFKEFIILQLKELEDYLSELKKQDVEKIDKDLKAAKESVSLFVKEIREAKKQVPELHEYLDPIEKRAKKISRNISQGLVEQKRIKREKKKQENLFLSMMSLQDYAYEMAHIIRTALEKILHKAEFFKRNYPDEKFKDLFKKYSVEIYEEVEKLSKAVNFMLSYAKSDLDFEQIDLKELIEDLMFKAYSEIFKHEGIKPVVEINDSVSIYHNRKFLEDIFENLISNSIKALKNKSEKIIKCSGMSYSNRFEVFFSDNGRGIEEEIKDNIFDIYQTSTADEGGAGIGLFIVKKRIEALKGTVEVVNSEFSPAGASFRIVIPFDIKKER